MLFLNYILWPCLCAGPPASGELLDWEGAGKKDVRARPCQAQKVFGQDSHCTIFLRLGTNIKAIFFLQSSFKVT